MCAALKMTPKNYSTKCRSSIKFEINIAEGAAARPARAKNFLLPSPLARACHFSFLEGHLAQFLAWVLKVKHSECCASTHVVVGASFSSPTTTIGFPRAHICSSPALGARTLSVARHMLLLVRTQANRKQHAAT
jgi:hypothetical protein